MKRINVFAFYTLASKLQPLSNLGAEATFGTVWWPLWQARDQIDTLLANQVIPVRTCRGVAGRLKAAISAVIPEDISEVVKQAQTRQDEKLDNYQPFTIKQALEAFQTVLAEELSLGDTYSVSKKGAYQMSDLIDNAEALLPDSVRKKLPSTAALDIQQAGKCFAFETPTAAGFHIFRAIETVMLAYHREVTGKPKPTKGRNWGTYIGTMRKSSKADPKILDALDHIREKYRNPVTHPEVTLSIEDVHVLLGLAVSVITLMLQAMAAKHPSQ